MSSGTVLVAVSSSDSIALQCEKVLPSRRWNRDWDKSTTSPSKTSSVPSLIPTSSSLVHDEDEARARPSGLERVRLSTLSEAFLTRNSEGGEDQAEDGVWSRNFRAPRW